MKDPASDFSLKHQPPEYYKCHLHTVLEKEKEGGGREERRELNGDEAETFGLNGVSLSLRERQNYEICLMVKPTDVLTMRYLVICRLLILESYISSETLNRIKIFTAIFLWKYNLVVYLYVLYVYLDILFYFVKLL